MTTRFLVLRKSDALTEAGTAPGEPWLDTVLHPSRTGVCVKFHDGKATVMPGPLEHVGELVAGFSMIHALSKDDAVDIVRCRLEEAGDDAVEIEVREAGCPGGMDGVSPKSEQRGLGQFAILLKSAQLEHGFIPGEPQLAAMSKRNDEAVAAGLMLSGEGLMPSVKGARVRKTGAGRISVIDGPFAEAKELVAGYWLIQASLIQAAVEWVKGYPYPLGGAFDVEIRPVA